MTRSSLEPQGRSADRSRRRSAAVDKTLATAVLDAQRRLDVAVAREPAAPTAFWALPADSVSIETLRNRIVAFARENEVPGMLVGDVRLCTSEALNNAVLHGFRGRATPGRMSASIEVDRGAERITVLVTDDGDGPAPRTDSPGLGLGLPIMSRLTRALTVGSGKDGAGTEVCMTFDMRRPAQGWPPLAATDASRDTSTATTGP